MKFKSNITDFHEISPLLNTLSTWHEETFTTEDGLQILI
jgi:hypothetical protein